MNINDFNICCFLVLKCRNPTSLIHWGGWEQTQKYKAQLLVQNFTKTSQQIQNQEFQGEMQMPWSEYLIFSDFSLVLINENGGWHNSHGCNDIKSSTNRTLFSIVWINIDNRERFYKLTNWGVKWGRVWIAVVSLPVAGCQLLFACHNGNAPCNNAFSIMKEFHKG